MRLVTIYCKPDCEMCREAEGVIRQVATRRRFPAGEAECSGRSGAAGGIWVLVPVVHVDGQEIARHRLTAFALEAALTR